MARQCETFNVDRYHHDTQLKSGRNGGFDGGSSTLRAAHVIHHRTKV